ncbi:hypothetical protein MJO28_002937 [Puccinia striiformis f. sp. tritici]|uniref:Uncharacterized protein n=1 Tax=Puccinia striiformis f. sp. tritici TaxID=168172 RepID=A0ACC0ETC8_9BASI|nr:hypothetical protein MJO28_002937 [Puccinia striiformis f. sp. tritici]
MHSCNPWQFYTFILILIKVVHGMLNCKPDHKHGIVLHQQAIKPSKVSKVSCWKASWREVTKLVTALLVTVMITAVHVGEDGFTCKDVQIDCKRSKHGTCCDGKKYTMLEGISFHLAFHYDLCQLVFFSETYLFSILLQSPFGISQNTFNLDCHNTY